MNLFGIIEDFRKDLAEEIGRREKDLGDGKAKDMEDYRRITGIIEGYRSAEDKFEEVVRNYMREEPADE